jgi:hypothetical protein
MALRQEEQLALRGVVSSPELLAGAHRDNRLVDLIARVPGVLARMKEGGQPVLLIPVQEIDADRGPGRVGAARKQDGECADRREVLPGRPP